MAGAVGDGNRGFGVVSNESPVITSPAMASEKSMEERVDEVGPQVLMTHLTHKSLIHEVF